MKTQASFLFYKLGLHIIAGDRTIAEITQVNSADQGRPSIHIQSLSIAAIG